MTVIWDVPEPVTCPLVTSMVSNIELSDVFLMVMFPLSASTFSLKLRTIVESTAIPVALSAGTDELNVGTGLVLVKLKAVVELIPAYDALPLSSKAVASIKT